MEILTLGRENVLNSNFCCRAVDVASLSKYMILKSLKALLIHLLRFKKLSNKMHLKNTPWFQRSLSLKHFDLT